MASARSSLSPPSDNGAGDVRGVAMERRSSGEQAAFYIRRLIFDGELRPRSRVPQDEIAKALGISRIPVREALIALEREGWVINELHRGMFVTPLDESSVRDHYQLFGLVYGFAVRLAMSRDGAEQLPGVLADLHKQLMAVDDATEIARLTLRFQVLMVEAAASPPTKVLLRSMSGLVPGNFFAYVPKSIEIERKGLGVVVRALKQQNPDKAAGAYASMMQQMGEQVVGLFRERGLFDADPGTVV
jgi:DNA-binding GntR family transcriptional regulator